MVIIRLSRSGAKKNPYYFITVADSRKPRDGAFIERLGFYNPLAQGQEEVLRIDHKKIDEWIAKGAQLSERVKKLLKDSKLSPEDLEKRKAKKKEKADAKKAAILAKQQDELKAEAESAAEDTPTEAVPVEAEAEDTSTEAEPVETEAAAEQAEDTPTEAEPVETEAAAEQAEDTPTEAEPVEAEPVETEQAEDTPTEAEPVETEEAPIVEEEINESSSEKDSKSGADTKSSPSDK